jgi:hypothetical protein
MQTHRDRLLLAAYTAWPDVMQTLPVRRLHADETASPAAIRTLRDHLLRALCMASMDVMQIPRDHPHDEDETASTLLHCVDETASMAAIRLLRVHLRDADGTGAPLAVRDPNPASADLRETLFSHPRPAHRPCDSFARLQDARRPRFAVSASDPHPTDA